MKQNIFYFFEDFIIKNKVELSIVDRIFEFIKVNNIDYLKLNNTERKLINITDIINTNLKAGEIPPDDPYRLPLQISFWKNHYLMTCLIMNQILGSLRET